MRPVFTMSALKQTTCLTRRKATQQREPLEKRNLNKKGGGHSNDGPLRVKAAAARAQDQGCKPSGPGHLSRGCARARCTRAGTPSGHKSVKARQHARDTWRRNATTWRKSCRRCDGSVWMASRNWATISSGDKSRVPIRVSNVESGNRHGSSFISPRFKTPATVCTFCAAQRQEDGETKEWVAWYSASMTSCECPNSARLSTS